MTSHCIGFSKDLPVISYSIYADKGKNTSLSWLVQITKFVILQWGRDVSSKYKQDPREALSIIMWLTNLIFGMLLVIGKGSFSKEK